MKKKDRLENKYWVNQIAQLRLIELQNQNK